MIKGRLETWQIIITRLYLWTFISRSTILWNKVSEEFTAHEIWLQWPYSEKFWNQYEF